MDFADFLSTGVDAPLRQRLWELFQKAEPKAMKIADLEGQWVPLTGVSLSENRATSEWIFHLEKKTARIEIKAKPGDLGEIFHEVFHSAFENSPLWKPCGKGVNAHWGEGFCDAFRCYMEKELLSREEAWYWRLCSELCEKSDQQVIRGARRDEETATKFTLRAVRVLEKAPDFNRFRQFWKERNDKPEESLAKYFNVPLLPEEIHQRP